MWGGTLPVEGDIVTVRYNWIMKLDVNTPILDVLFVDGTLYFDDSQDITLRAKHIYVRHGKLIIGDRNSGVRYPQKAIIELHGVTNSVISTKDQAIEAGDRNIINTGTLDFFGKEIDVIMTRLQAPVEADANTIMLDPDDISDWEAGARIGLAPTSFDPLEGEDAIIDSINHETGQVTLTENLEHYHYGSADSDTVAGVDMRCEVVYLTRNIKIKPVDNTWGATVRSTDLIFENENIYRIGVALIDYVEFEMCSQKDT